MTDFKAGDKIRRIDRDPREIIQVGSEVTVESVKPGGMVTLCECTGLWYPGRFELVLPARKTDAELAKEYRDAVVVLRASRLALLERGFHLSRGGNAIATAVDCPVEEYIFTKTVKPDPIVTVV